MNEQMPPAVTGPVEPTVMQHTPGPWVADKVTPRILDGEPYWRVGVVGGTCLYVGCGDGHEEADAHLIAAAPDLLAACVNARDLLATDRQAFIDCNRVQGSRTEDAVAHGLVWVDEDTWIEPEDAEPLRDYDRAIALIDAAMAKAAGGAA